MNLQMDISLVEIHTTLVVEVVCLTVAVGDGIVGVWIGAEIPGVDRFCLSPREACTDLQVRINLIEASIIYAISVSMTISHCV
mgnify:FL=1